jgi:DNA adenine methylase
MWDVPTLVKWAGGKKQLLTQFAPFFPHTITRYFEPFVGGGAVAFHIAKTRQPKEMYLFDVNESLIASYQVARDNVNDLIALLGKYEKQHSKEFYYRVRAQDSSKLSPLERAARLIYLNKTCFNGLHRVNARGQFNVPMGSYKRPAILQENDLREISQLLRNATVERADFAKVIDHANRGDFVYFDPPYYPLAKGKNFTTYAKGNFLAEEQIRLAKVFNELDARGCKLMLSNSDTELIRTLYAGYNIHVVKAKRMINSNAKGRGPVNELVITNYPVLPAPSTKAV